MIVLKTQSELKTMMKAMRISAETLNIAEETIREGITTKELDKAMYDFIIRSGAKPSFLGLYGFPAGGLNAAGQRRILKRRKIREMLSNCGLGAFFTKLWGKIQYQKPTVCQSAQMNEKSR